MSEELVSTLQTVIMLLAMVETDELKRHVESCANQLQRADSVGAILDPTGFRNAMADGSYEDAKLQLAITRHLLAARIAVDEREAHAAKYRQ